MSQETFANLPSNNEKEEDYHGTEFDRVQSTTSTLLDPHDPLNWSWRKKHLVLGAICYMTFMTDFLSGYGVPMIVSQATDWNISLENATRSVSGNTFMQGFGGLFAVPAVQRFGTQPVMFWSTLMTLLMTITCGLCPGWIGFIAVRVVQGFFAATAQVIGLTVIQNIFYFEEHARKVGFWGWAITIGPYFGPFLSALILAGLTWRQSFGVVSGILAIGFLLVVFVTDETFYDRENPENNPPRVEGYWKYKAYSLSGVMGYRAKNRPSLWDGAVAIVMVFIKPHLLAIFFYHGMTFMWSVGINGSLIDFLVAAPSAGGYGFSSVGVGLIYLSPIIAVLLGEAFGHFFNDSLQTRSIRKNRGLFVPEDRLWATYLATTFMVLGIVLLGVSLEHHWPWIAVAVFWGLFVFAVMTSTVVVSAYELDCFPMSSAQASALLNFTRVLFGFLVPLFQTEWADAVGATWSFATQGIICAVAFFVFIPVVQRFGKHWRSKTTMSPDVIKVRVP